MAARPKQKMTMPQLRAQINEDVSYSKMKKEDLEKIAIFARQLRNLRAQEQKNKGAAKVSIFGFFIHIYTISTYHQ